MEWTTTPPTEPGWYWAWNDDAHTVDDPIDMQCVCVWEHEGQLLIAGMGLESELLDWFYYWLGPLPKPAPPAVPNIDNK